MKVAHFLESHPAVEMVHYPGLHSHPQRAIAHRQMVDPDRNFAPGIMIYFKLKGEAEEAREVGRMVMDHLADNSLAITLAVSLGQIRTLIEHPASMTHAPIPVADQIKAGIDPGGIRLSIGLEAAEDIISDLDEALTEAISSIKISEAFAAHV
jgi:cystathionine beta-lyase/cystathionine gamma-synthase